MKRRRYVRRMSTKMRQHQIDPRGLNGRVGYKRRGCLNRLAGTAPFLDPYALINDPGIPDAVFYSVTASNQYSRETKSPSCWAWLPPVVTRPACISSSPPAV